MFFQNFDAFTDVLLFQQNAFDRIMGKPGKSVTVINGGCSVEKM